MTWESAISAFFTLFVIANILPTLPTVLDQTADLEKTKGRAVRLEALIIANILVLIFALVGPAAFKFVGVNINDLRIAGGTILLTFATYDLLFSRATRKEKFADWTPDEEATKVVPLGIPIMAGPATMVTALVVFEDGGILIGLFAWTLNLVLNILILILGEKIVGIFGEVYSKAFAKLMSLFLATIAVAMIRTGVLGLFTEFAY